MNGKWTAQTVREELPDVDVVRNGKTFVGMIRGRKLDEPKVWIITEQGDWVGETFSWRAITLALNSGHALRF